MSEYENVRVERAGAACQIILNRPHARNSATMELIRDLATAVKEIASDQSIKVLVLRGEGADFCAGGDIKSIVAGNTSLSDPVDPELYQMPRHLREAPFVSIAAIRGACAGVGLAWAAACDLRFCDDTAKFNSAFLGVGMAGEMGPFWTLPRIVGAGKAKELYFLPGKFDANEAYRIGLVERMYPQAEFDGALSSVVEELTAAAPLALRSMKVNFAEAERFPLGEYLGRETDRAMAAGRDPDGLEAFKARAEKRAPVFSDRADR